MKRRIALTALLALAACADQPETPLASGADRPAKFIVVMKDDAFPGPRLSISAGVRGVAEEAGVRPKFVYSAALKGFAAELTPAQLGRFRADPRVAYVEPDAQANLFTTQLWPTWGIDRIDETDLPLSSSFTYTNNGLGVVAYVLDTGVRKTHQQLSPRADYIPNGANGDFVGDGHGSAADCHGHGTHVAGTIGSTTYGVAKSVRIRAGRVVDCGGYGNASMAIAGMDWIAANGYKPAVVNMSLGYGNVQSVRDAAAALTDSGFVVVAAAGNGDFAGNPLNACNESPAGELSILTVGATTSSDNESSFSNYGTCVDLLAPGSSIKSTWIANDTSTMVRSGTSMAAPHVAGVVAQYLQTHQTTLPWAVMLVIKGNTTANTITLHAASAANGTPNKFLFTNY